MGQYESFELYSFHRAAGLEGKSPFQMRKFCQHSKAYMKPTFDYEQETRWGLFFDEKKQL